MVGDVKEAFALVDNYSHQGIVEFEDTGVVALRFHSGVLGSINFTINSYAGNMEGSLTIFAEKGTVKIGGQYLGHVPADFPVAYRHQNEILSLPLYPELRDDDLTSIVGAIRSFGTGSDDDSSASSRGRGTGASAAE